MTIYGLTKHYWHTESRSSGASKGLRRGQVRDVGGRDYILLYPSKHKGEWVVGRYGDGTTAPDETRTAVELRRCRVTGRVRLSLRDVDSV